jgi:Predicted xylanase/chitin deacetylase
MKFLKASLIFTLAVSAYAQSQSSTAQETPIVAPSQTTPIAAPTQATSVATPSQVVSTVAAPSQVSSVAAPSQATQVAAPTQESVTTQQAPVTPATQTSNEITGQALGKASVYYHCKQPNTIAFTIDDGPTEHTDALLAALEDAGITATFYINGANALRDANWEALDTVVPFIKKIYEKGHEIGSHTYNHACLTQQCKTNNPEMKVMDTFDNFKEQILKNEEIIYKAINKYPASYRAPFGDGQNPGQVSEQLLEWLYELGYPYAIHWDIETRDMENTFIGGIDLAFTEAKKQYESDVAAGNTLITLQHAIPVTIEKIIPYIKNEWMPKHPQMKFVKVSECLGLSPEAVYKKEQGPVVPAKVESSDAKMVRASYALFVSAVLALLYLF